jgi:mRNA interferase RelE/StbE
MWRARRGQYRVRYRIDEDRHRIVVLDVDHRRDAHPS